MSSQNNRLKYPVAFHQRRGDVVKGRFVRPRPLKRKKRRRSVWA